MSQEERTGFRDRVFSGWRRASGKSLLDKRHTAQDIDWMEFCFYHGDPVALIEAVCCFSPSSLMERATEKAKKTRSLKMLAERAGISAYVMAYVTNGIDEVTHGVFIDLFSNSSTQILNGNEISKFIHGIHSSCKQCQKCKINCEKFGIDWPDLSWRF